ncbi:hypothetical protein KSF_054810 [Reticulibacter mediterranei]|uniref:Zinc finger CHC2-type domain-containing protein n=1 Tax=Reticulibacter mediterranei TaxID=2778369 RepID=A0A8J3IKG0_9CHLR|nr:hypothetical protein KSF_054810 [Reticulibacter mediterranei]
MYAVTREIVELYASLFVHCRSYYAVQQRDGSYRPSRQPLTLALLASHLQGRFTLGTYVVDRAGYCSFAVFDADSEDGLERLALLARVLVEQDIFLILEASRRGGHGWVHFKQPIQAVVVRTWLLPYAQAFGMELYPKQDEVRADGFGSLVRLPLGVHRRSGGWYPFVVVSDGRLLVPVGETVAACCLWAGEQVQRVSVPCEVEESVYEENNGEVVAFGAGQLGRGMIRAWCREQDIVEVIGRYTLLDRRGVGRCPLPGHHYRGDARPSLQVFGGDDPHWYCYTWGRAGDVFDFLRLFHGLSVREAWERLQQGMLF